MRSIRLCKARWATTCLDGEGARQSGGRWNSKGVSIVYSSGSLSLATLELFVHVDPLTIPSDLVSIELNIPDDIVVRELHDVDLPNDWRTTPHTVATQAIGDAWVSAKKELVLSVPSVVVPAERNLLLNPAHPDIGRVTMSAPQPFSFDPRMWK